MIMDCRKMEGVGWRENKTFFLVFLTFMLTSNILKDKTLGDFSFLYIHFLKNDDDIQ